MTSLYLICFLAGDSMNSADWISLMTTLGTLCIGVIGYFLKRTMSRVDKTEEDVHHIKLTYVTTDQLRDFKGEVKADISGLEKDVKEIKEKCLTKDDFYRSQMDVNKKIDQIMEILLKRNGGNRDE